MILAALSVLIGLLWMRHMSKKYRRTTTEPSGRHRDLKAEQEAAVHRLREEYEEKLDAGDPDVLETSRDWADNDGTPWRAEIGLSLGALVLIVIVPLLILFFAGIKALVGQ